MRACRFSTSAIARRSALAMQLSWTPRRWNSEDAKAEAEAKDAKAEEAKPSAEVEEKVAKLEKQLEEKTSEAKELKEKMLYAVADADNARRIAKIDIDKAKDFSVTAIAKDMLEVCDTLAKAIESFEKLDAETTKKAAPVLTGVKMSNQVLLHNLGRHGIEKMKVERGTKFDPNQHDALFKAPTTDDLKEDHIAAVVKDGYMIKERVLRAAQVGVAEPQ
eukprot:CAMPEP_0174852716 /NCGR_PEP_ID=MMETSP1114-20130205/26486_1 /TAXON_ID=312471 /ORGANISM="Neobodo designis, Strain CCAP 1951/1" /LENGTH=218 /DNA_ID=CAMNT_0016087325 /DNA_START=49 /DNA_END=705 /DNA_ORIENTATION=+